MDEKDIDEILLINWNLVKQKFSKQSPKSVEFTRDQLTNKINHMINNLVCEPTNTK